MFLENLTLVNFDVQLKFVKQDICYLIKISFILASICCP
jgi:hypothetical protein